MNSFKTITAKGETVRFNLYIGEAPETSQAFLNSLPFSRDFFHAKVSGEEIWTPDGLELSIAQENSTVFIDEGEIVLGPLHKRNKVSKCIGIMYGEGKLLDCGNIFGKVFKEDLPLLKEIGKRFWLSGKERLTFEVL
ncbi:MAG: hypothetical protein JWO06_4114 [Bacteroidota bacterium]|nr:hypothetical protein [Bacteroidota bacterium]